jgi:hypothetical protein
MIDTKKERTYRDTAYNPLYVPLPQHNPRSGNEEEKRLSTSDSTGQGSATSKPPLGSRNIANYFTCIMSALRMPACRCEGNRTLQPLPEPGLVCESEADRVPKAEARSAPVGLAQPCTPAYPLTTTACGMSEGTPSCVLPPVTVCYQ